MPVKYRDLISVPHLGSLTPPCWATRCTSSRRTWPTTAGCKTRRFSAVLTPDIIPEWPKWSVLANGDSEAGVPREQEHGGLLHVPQGGHQHSQIHSHIKVSVEYGLNHVFMDLHTYNTELRWELDWESIRSSPRNGLGCMWFGFGLGDRALWIELSNLTLVQISGLI